MKKTEKTKPKRAHKLRRARRKLISLPLVIILIALMLISTVSAVAPSRLGVGEDSVLAAVKPFTIVVLPDTQYYSQEYTNLFDTQTQWIADNKKSKNIVFVTHLGDIVNVPNDDKQWQVASAAFGRIDKIVTYGIAPGNHDLEVGGASPEFNKYFPMRRIQLSGVPEYLRLFEASNSADFGHFGSKNSYRLFNAGGSGLIAFNLEFCPPDSVVDWTDKMLKHYPDRKAIITTHSFLNAKGDREVGSKCRNYNSEGFNGGEDLWQKLVIQGKNANIFMFLNGHDIWSEFGASRKTDYVNGRPVHQLMSDYQESPLGGSAYMRLMTFEPLKKKIEVKTYSPYLKHYLTDKENSFFLSYY